MQLSTSKENSCSSTLNQTEYNDINDESRPCNSSSYPIIVNGNSNFVDDTSKLVLDQCNDSCDIDSPISIIPSNDNTKDCEILQLKRERDEAKYQAKRHHEQLEAILQAIKLASRLASTDTPAVGSSLLPTFIEADIDKIQRKWKLEETSFPNLITCIHRLHSHISNLRMEADTNLNELREVNNQLHFRHRQNQKLKKALKKLYQKDLEISQELSCKKKEKQNFVRKVKSYVIRKRKEELEKDEIHIATQLTLHESMLKTNSSNSASTSSRKQSTLPFIVDISSLGNRKRTSTVDSTLSQPFSDIDKSEAFIDTTGKHRNYSYDFENEIMDDSPVVQSSDEICLDTVSNASSSSYITSRPLVTNDCVATVMIVSPLPDSKNSNSKSTSSFAGMITHVKKKKKPSLILNDPVNTTDTVIEHNISQPISSHNSIAKHTVGDTSLVSVNANNDDEICKQSFFNKLKGNKANCSNTNTIAITENVKQKKEKHLFFRLGASRIKKEKSEHYPAVK